MKLKPHLSTKQKKEAGNASPNVTGLIDRRKQRAKKSIPAYFLPALNGFFHRELPFKERASDNHAGRARAGPSRTSSSDPMPPEA